MLEVLKVDPRISRSLEHQLFSQPTMVARITDFNEDSLLMLSQQLSVAVSSEQRIFPVVIDSPGGEVYSMFGMIDLLQDASSDLTIATIAIGKAFSAGACLLSCGSDGFRFIAPNATVMIHDAAVPICEGGKSEDLRADANETARLTSKIYSTIEANIGVRAGMLQRTIEKRKGADWYLSAEDALEINLVNCIGIPTLQTTVSVQVDLAISPMVTSKKKRGKNPDASAQKTRTKKG